MARYELADPRLQDHLDRLAAAEAAVWPAPDGEALAILARLLKPAPTALRPVPVAAPTRRAA
jgi:hypothetical protein